VEKLIRVHDIEHGLDVVGTPRTKQILQFFRLLLFCWLHECASASLVTDHHHTLQDHLHINAASANI
jgi:hypothetical protein